MSSQTQKMVDAAAPRRDALLRLFRTVLLTSACSLLAGCLSTVDPSGSIENESLRASWVRPSDPQEKIGAREHPAVLAKYGGVYSNLRAENMIAVIVGRLVAVSSEPDRVYKITILNSPRINAFALPGGYLYVTRGLLALANDASELAAVIAHEMAHVEANHAILRRDKAKSAAIGSQVAADVLGNTPAAKIAIEANKTELARFSQDQELQADAVGIRMIGRAGFDPFAAARFLETMGKYQSALNRSRSGFGDGFLSSHPSTPKRIDLAKRHARFFGAPGVGDRDRDRYLKSIDGLMFGDSADEGFVRGNTYAHAGLGIRFTAPKGMRIENQAKSVTVSGNGDVATRFDATVKSTRGSLSDYIKSGWVNGLQEETILEETFASLPSVTAKASGEGWHFRIRVLQNGSQLYRFITAGPLGNSGVDAQASEVAGSFELLSPAEAANLKPLEVNVISAKAGDTLGKLAGRMQTDQDRLELFKVMNDIRPGQSIEVGRKYKLIGG